MLNSKKRVRGESSVQLNRMNVGHHCRWIESNLCRYGGRLLTPNACALLWRSRSKQQHSLVLRQRRLGGDRNLTRRRVTSGSWPTRRCALGNRNGKWEMGAHVAVVEVGLARSTIVEPLRTHTATTSHPPVCRLPALHEASRWMRREPRMCVSTAGACWNGARTKRPPSIWPPVAASTPEAPLPAGEAFTCRPPFNLGHSWSLGWV